MRFLASIFALVFATLSAQAAKVTETRLTVGKLETRAILRVPTETTGKRPLVIMLTGSGANGPECVSVPENTVDYQPHALFDQFGAPLNEAGAITLALGKPGVEYFDLAYYLKHKQPKFYNFKYYDQLRWSHVLETVKAAVDLALKLDNVDKEKIYILGHSEGSQVAVDYAFIDARVRGLILLGFSGENMAKTLDWQLFKREVEFLIATDVDKNHNGYVDRQEASLAKNIFSWQFKPGQNHVALSELEAYLRANQKRQDFFKEKMSKPLYADGIGIRTPIYQKTASLKQDVFVFTGDLDMQTPAREAKKLAETCAEYKKKNCWVSIVPNLGHAFSIPRPPRYQPVLDMTLGPVHPKFQNVLYNFATKIF